LSVEVLEERNLLDASANYLPPTQMLINPTGLLTTPTAGQPLQIALAYLNAHAADLGLTPTDLQNVVVANQYTDSDTGISHVALQQTVNGLDVASAYMTVGLTAQGEVISAGGSFVPNLSSLLPPGSSLTPSIGAVDAVNAAARMLGLTPTQDPVVVSAAGDIAQTCTISAPGVSLDDIPAHVQYVPTPDGSAVLAWDVVLRTPDGQHWYDLTISGNAGTMVTQNDWVEHESYNVVAPPNESPQDGGFTLQNNPADALASPFGWHDTNGVAGAEFTDTRGNNVDAHLDRNNNNVPDADEGGAPRPDGGASLDFSGFTQDPLSAPTTQQNQNIAQVNLYYTNNIAHDIHYHYGFTEAAGNFQVNNYGRGGAGNDAVQADAQDGGGLNNANFATPPDGTAPRMQMYLFNSTNPNRDGDLDNGVIIHEYGHGVSNRLTGGLAGSGNLSALQSGGMGEGWSDFFALMFLQRPTDRQYDSFTIGTYVEGQPQNGPGIRRHPYSLNMTIDPITFSAFNGGFPNNEVHNTGEIWCSALWDMNELLIEKYGYDSNLYTGWTAAAGPGHAGNKLALRLVEDAMKLQPANPSFIDARNAIIAADNALDGGADLCEIWTAFARRGLGQLASTASASSATVTVDFTIPAGICNRTVTITVDDSNWGFHAYGPGWSTVAGGFNGTERTHAGGGTGSNFAQWQYGQNVTAGNSYIIYVTWVAAAGNATNAAFNIYDGATLLATVLEDQTQAPLPGMVGTTMVQQLYTYTPTITGYHVIRVQLSDNANGTVAADCLYDPPVGAEPAATSPAAVASGQAQPASDSVSPAPVVSDGSGSAVAFALPEALATHTVTTAAPSVGLRPTELSAGQLAPALLDQVFTNSKDDEFPLLLPSRSRRWEGNDDLSLGLPDDGSEAP
jgi:extracellular elastinolytic metalloproteinase